MSCAGLHSPNELLHSLRHGPGVSHLPIGPNGGSHSRCQGRVPVLNVIEKGHTGLRSGEGVGMLKSRNERFSHALSRLPMRAKDGEQLSGNCCGLFTVALHSLEAADEPVRILPTAQSDGEDAATHGVADFLICPVALMETGMQ